MNKHSLLFIAVSSVLATSQVIAAQVTKVVDLSNPAPLIYASENPDSITALSAYNPKLIVPIPTDYEVTATNQYFVKIALTNGASFSDAITPKWTMSCRTGANANWVLANLQLGAGTNFLTFRVQPAAGLTKATLNKASSGCVISGAQFALKSGMKDIGYSAVVEYTIGTSPATKPYVGSLITFKEGLVAKFDAPGSTPTIDVGAGSKSFFAGSSLGDKTAYIGRVTYAPNTTYSAMKYSTGAQIDTPDVLNSLSITMQGLPLGALTTSGGVYINTSNNCTVGTRIVPTKKASGTSIKYSFAANSSTAQNIKGGMYFCYHNKDNNAMDKGKITVTLAGTGLGSFRPVFGSEGTLVDIRKNGASTRVLNIPSPDNTADTAFIRINNMSSRAGVVTGTLYGQDGVILGTANTTIAELKAYEVAVLNSSDIAGKFGISVWTGRAWLQIDSEISQLSVQNLVRNNATNSLLNVSDGVSPY